MAPAIAGRTAKCGSIVQVAAGRKRVIPVREGFLPPVTSLAQRRSRRTCQVADVCQSADLGRELFLELLDQLTDVNGRVASLDRKISEICREREDCCRLSELPGVGPIIATSLVASVEDGRHFKSGRELAAWIGLVPRQYTTGGKPRLGGIGRRANHYLRRQMTHGARAVISRLASHDDHRSQCLKELVARRGFNKAIVALANKTARVAWALLTRQERTDRSFGS